MEFSPGKVEKILISLRIEEPFLNKGYVTTNS